MSKEGPIIEKIITEIDWFIIQRIRELRKDKFSQMDLSIAIGFSESFVSRIENPKYGAVYSHRHINLIAKALKVKITDIVPANPLPNDLVRLTIRIHPPSKPKKGEPNYEVIKINPLTEKEIIEYNNSVLNRPSKSGTPLKSMKGKSKKGK